MNRNFIFSEVLLLLCEGCLASPPLRTTSTPPSLLRGAKTPTNCPWGCSVTSQAPSLQAVSFVCAPFLYPPGQQHPTSPCSTNWLWGLQLLSGPEGKFLPETPWLHISRAKQNCLGKMDYRIRSYYGTAQGQLFFQCQQVLRVLHFWQEHLTNETQTIMLWTSMFLQCFNGLYSGSGLTVFISWATSLR